MESRFIKDDVVSVEGFEPLAVVRGVTTVFGKQTFSLTMFDGTNENFGEKKLAFVRRWNPETDPGLMQQGIAKRQEEDASRWAENNPNGIASPFVVDPRIVAAFRRGMVNNNE